MKKCSIICMYFFLIIFSDFVYAALPSENVFKGQHIIKKVIDLTIPGNAKKLLTEYVIDNHEFFGLASYYNKVRFFVVDSEGLNPLSKDQTITLRNDEWFAVVGRFNVLVFQHNGAEIKIKKNDFEMERLRNEAIQTDLYIVEKSKLELASSELNQLRYSHLWFPIAILARSIEWSIVKIHKHIVHNWVLSIFVLSFFLKLLLLPIGVMTTSFQRKVSQQKAILAPQLEAIKFKYDGEEAHKRIMLVHKSLGISSFYTLKPILGSLIQIPIWVATFNTLGEMPQLAGTTFLWIDDIAYPDVIVSFDSLLPMFGNKISLLPCLMLCVTILSSILSQNRLASSSELNRQKRNLYLMTIAFFILFYPFPASMLIFWTTNNFLHLFQQKVIKI